MSIKKGIYAASMTVINKDLTVNVDATIKHAEKVIQQGCHATVIGGSTGMMQLISSNEKKKLILANLKIVLFLAPGQILLERMSN